MKFYKYALLFSILYSCEATPIKEGLERQVVFCNMSLTAKQNDAIVKAFLDDEFPEKNKDVFIAKITEGSCGYGINDGTPHIKDAFYISDKKFIKGRYYRLVTGYVTAQGNKYIVYILEKEELTEYVI